MMNDNIKLLKELTEKLTVKDEALIKSEFRFRALFNNLPICIHEIDKFGRITSMNPHGLGMIDANEEDVIGINYLDFVHECDLERITELLEDAKNGQETEFIFTTINNDVYQSCFTPILIAGKTSKIIGYSNDITEKVKQDKLERVNLVKSMSKIVNKLSKIKSIDDLVKSMESILKMTLSVEYTGLYLLDPETEKLKLYSAKGFTKKERLEAEKTAMERHPGIVFKKKKKLNIKDTNKDKLTTTSNRSFEVGSRIYLPVMCGEECVGAYGFASSKSNAFGEEHISLLEFMCELSGIMYKNIIK
jgi:PAS domain S-box-containing protein